MGINILHLSCSSEETRYAYISKHNLKCEKQVIFLMITYSKK